MNSNFWNERYAEQEFAYGKNPNAFLKEILPTIKSGNILLPCEGEGRNAVYAAEKGWTVFAFDYSEKAIEKALSLAHEHFVHLQYDLFNVEDFHYDQLFDAIGLFFTHFSKENQQAYYTKIINNLKPGGYLIGELFSEKQTSYQDNYNSGGPKDVNMLLSIKKMITLFPEIEFEILNEQEVLLDEGLYHQGLASIIRYKGKKRSLEKE